MAGRRPAAGPGAAGEEPAAPGPLDEELAALQRLPPDAFTAERDALARRLRAEGRRDDAAAVKARRRPTVVAWAADQLALRTPEALEELFAATDALAQAQAELLAGGDRDALRRAAADRRAVVDRLARTAGSWLVAEGVADAAHLEELAATLEAAAADPDVGEELRRGLLVREQAAPSGFGLGLGLGSPPAPARRRGAPAAPARGQPTAAGDGAGGQGVGAGGPDGPPADEEEAAARREAEAAAARRRAAEAAADDAREAADAAAAAAGAVEAAQAIREDAAADVAALEERLAEARSALEAAEADLAARRAEAERAGAAAAEAEARRRVAADAAPGAV